MTRDGILRTFNVYGKINHINMPFDGRNRPRGLAFIIYETHGDAKRALDVGLNGIVLGQRKLRVEVFKPLETLNMERKEKTKLNSRMASAEKDAAIEELKAIE